MRQLLLAFCCLALALSGPAVAIGADYGVAGIDDPQQVTAFVADLQRAVREGDKAAIAALVDYPLKARVEGKTRTIKDKAAFIKDYNAIMTMAVQAAVADQNPAALFANSQGLMFGNGQVWIGLTEDGLRIIAINN